jgi:hypothetical protein
MKTTSRSVERGRAVPFAILTAGMLAVAACSDAGPAAAGSAPGPAGPSGAAESRPIAWGETWPVTECGTYSGTGCAPTSERVDVEKPVFSNPTRITNPLYPIARNRSVVQLGNVEDGPFRSETTLLPRTGTVDWDGKRIQVLLVQYVAYVGDRLQEAAIDRYAQADDGAVWYFGEDVYDYADGTVTETAGTWLAGRDGPPAMIMPGRPAVGDVFRVENVTGVVFEELRVTSVAQTVQGPSGPVRGAVVADELGLANGHSEKVFAPGYGEFRTTNAGELEAVAVAASADALDVPLPPDQRSLSTGAWGVVESVRVEDWDAAARTVPKLAATWTRLRAARQPPMVAEAMDKALAALAAAVRARQPLPTLRAATEVAQSALDLQQRYLPVEYVDVERFHLHAQRLRIGAAEEDAAAVLNEVAAMEWTLDRIPLTPAERQAADAGVRALRIAADGNHLASAADHAARVAARLRSPS